MIRRFLSAAAFGVSLVMAAGATGASAGQELRTINKHRVFDIGNGQFEVISRAASAPADYWCGAGEYTRRILGKRGVVPIYVVETIGPSVSIENFLSVKFSLTPPASGEVETYSITAKPVGKAMSQTFAEQYCRDSAFYLFFDRDR
jgi:hypothetical protein